MALVSEPDLLLLDEPTTGMDVEGRREFWTSIREDAASGRTVVFATHYLEEADAYADRIVLVSQGRIVADGSAAEIKNLASGRTVSAQLTTGAGHPDPEEVAANLRAIAGVESVDVRGPRVLVRAHDSDSVARYLLGMAAHDLEISSHNLEDAFVALTSQPQNAIATGASR